MLNTEVNRIFECIFLNTVPSEDIYFQIVIVDPTDNDLSPPSCEFDNGLYILLKESKAKKNEVRTLEGSPPVNGLPIPSNLEHL